MHMYSSYYLNNVGRDLYSLFDVVNKFSRNYMICVSQYDL